MLTNPTIREFGGGGPVRRKRLAVSRIVGRIREMFATRERGS